MGRIKDITGQRFGKLVVLEDSGKRQGSSVMWKCRCDCGNITYATGSTLKKGNTKSCGCLVLHPVREPAIEIKEG